MLRRKSRCEKARCHRCPFNALFRRRDDLLQKTIQKSQFSFYKKRTFKITRFCSRHAEWNLPISVWFGLLVVFRVCYLAGFALLRRIRHLDHMQAPRCPPSRQGQTLVLTPLHLQNRLPPMDPGQGIMSIKPQKSTYMIDACDTHNGRLRVCLAPTEPAPSVLVPGSATFRACCRASRHRSKSSQSRNELFSLARLLIS